MARQWNRYCCPAWHCWIPLVHSVFRTRALWWQYGATKTLLRAVKMLAEHKNGKSILLVDDEGSSLEMLQAALESWGYGVWVAADGEEALLTCKLKSPAAVIADVVMPRLDGLSLLRRLKEANPDAIVILCAAHASLQTAISAIKGGATDLLPKPIDFGRLKHLLDGLFGEDGNSEEPPPGLSTPAGSGTRPPESNLTMRGMRPQGYLPQCRDLSSLSGGRLSAPGSVYQRRKSLIN